MVTLISIHADPLAGKPCCAFPILSHVIYYLMTRFLIADEVQAECLGNRVQFTLPGSLSAGGPLELYAVSKLIISLFVCQ